MQTTLYGLKNCDTCKKALKALQAAGKTVTFIDIRQGADLSVKVPVWLDAVGSEILINRRSTTWRTLDETSRQVDPAQLLIGAPTLMKRPVIETDDRVYAGWSKATEAALT